MPSNHIDVANFIQLRGFSEEWDELGLSDEDLRELEIAIMLSPEAFPRVKGTGGLRKVRFSPKGWRRGKSGALRVGYVFFKEYQIVVFVILYSKGEKDDISPAGKKAIKNLIGRLENELSRGPVK